MFDHIKNHHQLLFSFSLLQMVGYREMLSIIQGQYPTFKRVSHEDERNDTAKAWTVPQFMGRVGFITSMSENFCGSCNRLRLTADGNLKVCLFGNTETNLRDPLRDPDMTDAQLIEMVGKAVMGKKARHAGMFKIASSKNRPMILIGGWFENYFCIYFVSNQNKVE